MNFSQNDEQKKPTAKGKIYDSIHIQFKDKQNLTMMIEVRKVLNLGQRERIECESTQEPPPESWKHVALSDGYMMVWTQYGKTQMYR